jgi:hypothetical protein
MNSTVFSSFRRTAPLLVALLSAAALPGAVHAEELSAAEKAEGFVSLFDGKTLAGWIGGTNAYAVRDGAIVCVQAKGGNLFTEKQYSDFVLRLDIKIPADANNGIAIRSPAQQGNLHLLGIELQILDDESPKHKGIIKPYQHHGSVYGVVPAKPGALKPTGEWNTQEVSVVGNRFKVVLNGQTIVDADVAEASKNGTPDGQEHPGLKVKKGHLGFLGHGSPVEFRNIRIRTLDSD